MGTMMRIKKLEHNFFSTLILSTILSTLNFYIITLCKQSLYFIDNSKLPLAGYTRAILDQQFKFVICIGIELVQAGLYKCDCHIPESIAVTSHQNLRYRVREMSHQMGAEETSALALILDHMNAYTDTMLLRCAIDLDIIDTIHRFPLGATLTVIAGALPRQPVVNHNHLHRILNYLVRMKLLNKYPEPEDTYTLSKASEYFLLENVDGVKNPRCLKPYIKLITNELSFSIWPQLSIAPFTDSSVLTEICGHTHFENENTGKEAENSERSDEAMAAFLGFQVPAVVKVLEGVMDGVGSLVDVAGGLGTVAAAIARAFPGVRCAVLEMPQVMARAKEKVAGGEVEFVSGDMFEHVPSADVVLLVRVLHGWRDERCLDILQRCKEVILKNSGKLIIVDMVLEEGKDEEALSKWQMRNDLAMMVFMEGKERSRKEWKALLGEAGFYVHQITTVLLGLSVIEARLK